jgi:hypothetical protein
MLLLTTPGIAVACGGFGFALNTAATFNVFRRLEVTNYGFFDILFESAPKRSNLVGVWVFCTHVSNRLPPNLCGGNVLAMNPGESKLKTEPALAQMSQRHRDLAHLILDP